MLEVYYRYLPIYQLINDPRNAPKTDSAPAAEPTDPLVAAR